MCKRPEIKTGLIIFPNLLSFSVAFHVIIAGNDIARD